MFCRKHLENQMDENYKKAKTLIEKHNQGHLLNGYENLTDAKKKKILEQINEIDFKQISKLYKDLNKKIDESKNKIEPIDCLVKENLSKSDYKKYEKIGVKEIKEGKLAVVTMAGGQGTRLGHSGPKGTYDLGLPSHKSIFEILCDTLKRAQKEYGVYVYWYIMTSNENNRATVSFFEKNNYFGYPKEKISFFKQGELPMIDTNGKILVGEDGLIKLAADGHGGIFYSMRDDGVIEDMKEKGIEWVFIGGVDNVLVNMVDPIIVGISIDKKVKAVGKSLIKGYPKEKVGVFCKKNGKPSVIEYSEISDEMAEATDENGELIYSESHILCNLFSLNAIEEMSKDKLPYHVAFKKAKYLDENGNVVKSDEPNAYKFEAFIFDAFEYLNDMMILRVKREDEFAPVKNASGVDSPETARKLYTEFHKKNK